MATPHHRNIRLERREDESKYKQHWVLLVDQGGHTAVNRFSAHEMLQLMDLIAANQLPLFNDAGIKANELEPP
jgi:hypothetical protein